jgi:hypothetical protein
MRSRQKQIAVAALVFTLGFGLYFTPNHRGLVRAPSSQEIAKQLNPSHARGITRALNAFSNAVQKEAKRLKIGVPVAKAGDGDPGENSSYLLGLVGIAGGGLANLPNATDCSSDPNVAVPTLLCLAGDYVNVNGFGLYTHTASNTGDDTDDYTLRVTYDGGTYDYYAELWGAASGQTQRRLYKIWKTRDGKKYKLLGSPNVIGGVPDVAISITVDTTDSSAETADLRVQVQSNYTGNTWADADSWKDWSNRFIVIRAFYTGYRGSSYAKMTIAANLSVGIEIVMDAVVYLNSTHQLAYGTLNINGGGASSPAKPYQCATRTSTGDENVDVFIVAQSGDSLADARSGSCSFVDSEANLPSELSGYVSGSTQSALELFDNSTNFPFSWEGAGNAVPSVP